MQFTGISCENTAQYESWGPNGLRLLRKNVCMTYRAEFYKIIMPGRGGILRCPEYRAKRKLGRIRVPLVPGGIEIGGAK